MKQMTDFLEIIYLMIGFDWWSKYLMTFVDFLFLFNSDCLFLRNVIALVTSILRFIFIVLSLLIVAFSISYCLLLFQRLCNLMFLSLCVLVYLIIFGYFVIIFLHFGWSSKFHARLLNYKVIEGKSPRNYHFFH